MTCTSLWVTLVLILLIFCTKPFNGVVFILMFPMKFHTKDLRISFFAHQQNFWTVSYVVTFAKCSEPDVSAYRRLVPAPGTTTASVAPNSSRDILYLRSYHFGPRYFENSKCASQCPMVFLTMTPFHSVASRSSFRENFVVSLLDRLWVSRTSLCSLTRAARR